MKDKAAMTDYSSQSNRQSSGNQSDKLKWITNEEKRGEIKISIKFARKEVEYKII